MYQVRLANKDEIVHVHNIMIQAFKEYKKYEVPSSAIAETVAFVESYTEQPNAGAILCNKDNQVVGSARFIMEEDALYFSRLSVLPCFRGKGLAKRMIAWLENHAISCGKSAITCNVRAQIESNIKLYESMGFIEVNREKIINPQGHIVLTVLMKKTLLS